MDVYGLTGGIGSGKSTVATLLEDYGIPVVSADELSRIVVAKGSEGLNDVVELFGPEVLDDKGELDRRKMAAIVFQEPDKRRDLELILHPRIRERFEQVLDALEKAGHEVAVYEVPLLFEKNLQGEMKAVVLVTADEAVRIARVKDRDDVTETEVRARIAAQMDEALKRKKADYVIENNGSMDELRREVEFVLARFLRIGGTPLDPQSDVVVTEVPVKTGSTLPPTPVADVGPDSSSSTAPTLPPPGAIPGGTPLFQPRPQESVPIPVAPTAPPRSRPARPSAVETPPPADPDKRDTVVPTKRDPPIPVRSGHTVIGPPPEPPDVDLDPSSLPPEQRPTVVSIDAPAVPAPLLPTAPNVPPVAGVPVPMPSAGSGPMSGPRPAVPPTPPPPPAAPVQKPRSSAPRSVEDGTAARAPKKSKTQPPASPGRSAKPAAPAPVHPTGAPQTPSPPPPPPGAAARPVSPPPPPSKATRGSTRPPAEDVGAQPDGYGGRPRTQTVRVNALTPEDLARTGAPAPPVPPETTHDGSTDDPDAL